MGIYRLCGCYGGAHGFDYPLSKSQFIIVNTLSVLLLLLLHLN